MTNHIAHQVKHIKQLLIDYGGENKELGKTILLGSWDKFQKYFPFFKNKSDVESFDGIWAEGMTDSSDIRIYDELYDRTEFLKCNCTVSDWYDETENRVRIDIKKDCFSQGKVSTTIENIYKIFSDLMGDTCKFKYLEFNIQLTTIKRGEKFDVDIILNYMNNFIKYLKKRGVFKRCDSRIRINFFIQIEGETSYRDGRKILKNSAINSVSIEDLRKLKRFSRRYPYVETVFNFDSMRDMYLYFRISVIYNHYCPSPSEIVVDKSVFDCFHKHPLHCNWMDITHDAYYSVYW